MPSVSRKVVEQELAGMFEKHGSFESVVEALLAETVPGALTSTNPEVLKLERIRLPNRVFVKKEDAPKEDAKKESPQEIIQRLSEEQKAEQKQDEKFPLANDLA